MLTNFSSLNALAVLKMATSISTSDENFANKPGLYFSHQLSAAVAYSFVARAGDYVRHRQSSFKCARALRKYKQSPNRTTKWSIHGIKIQMRIQMRIQVSLLTPRNNIVCASWMATHIVSMISGWPICLGREYSRYWLACAYHLFQSFRRCFSMNSPTFWRFSNQGNGGMHRFVNLDV